jgi:hypothetical protein
MSNATPSTKATQFNGDTAPLLDRGPIPSKTQSSVSRWYCKLTNQPDDITIGKRLTECYRQGTLAATIVRP